MDPPSLFDLLIGVGLSFAGGEVCAVDRVAVDSVVSGAVVEASLVSEAAYDTAGAVTGALVACTSETVRLSEMGFGFTVDCECAGLDALTGAFERTCAGVTGDATGDVKPVDIACVVPSVGTDF